MIVATEFPVELLASGGCIGVQSSCVGELLAQVADAPVGAWVAVLLDGIDPSELSSWDLATYVKVRGRLQAWSAALLADGVAELASRSDVDRPDFEVAVALAEPVGAAQRRIWHAKRLRRLPETMRRFCQGDLSERHAIGMVEATARVDDPELAGEVERRALRSLAGKTATELRKHARRILTRLDPEGAQDRARAARDDADVSFEADEDGMSDVCARLPVEDGRMVKEAVDAYAISAKHSGDSRRVGVLRAEALAGWAADYLSGHSRSATAPRSGGRPIEIGIVIGLDTALGRDQLPGEVPGCGLVPREVVARMIATELPKLRLLVVDEKNGRLVYRATDGYRPTPEQIAHVRAAWVTSAGPGSQVFASRCDTDHVIPHPDGPTSVDNLIPPDRTWHLGKTRRALSVTVHHDGSATWNTALGQSRTVSPYEYLPPNEEPETEP